MAVTTTSRPPFRLSYRRRSTTTRTTTTTRPNSTKDSVTVTGRTPSSRGTKPSRRRTTTPITTSSTVSGGRIGSQSIESQVITTLTPPRINNRFKFVSRRPYLRTTTSKNTFNMTENSNQTLVPANKENLENGSDLSRFSESQRYTQQSTSKSKPSRKRPQIAKVGSQYSTQSTIGVTTASTNLPVNPSVSNSSPQKSRKNTIAITLPFVRSSIGSVQDITGNKFHSQPVVTGKPLVQQVFNSPQTITAQDFISKFRYSTTASPVIIIAPSQPTNSKRRQPSQVVNKAVPVAGDYYDYGNLEASISDKIPEHSKVLLHTDGSFECLDQGNFPHPISCKKFISCARMENGRLIGWEYTCPKDLSFDPIGGMCNWSADVGCNA